MRNIRFERYLVATSFLLMNAWASVAQDDSTDYSADTVIGTTHPAVDEKDQPVFSRITDTLHLSLRTVPAGARNKMQEDDEFWYANTDLKKSRQEVLEQRERGIEAEKDKRESTIKERPLRTPLSHQPWFQNLLWFIIIVGFVVFLAIYLANSQVGLFRKKARRTMEEDADPEMEDIFAISYEKEIRKAVAEGNYRLAIRLHFLKLLRKLSETDIIRYKQDKTNFDYLTELQPTRYYNQFFRATRNYEYSWYGLFPVTGAAYEVIKRDFEQLDQQLGHH